MRPCGLTSVISHITRPAQPSDILPRCIRCQSLAEPLSELYWHIGDTTTRLGRVSPRKVMGENRTLAISEVPLVLRFRAMRACNTTNWAAAIRPKAAPCRCNLRKAQPDQSVAT